MACILSVFKCRHVKVKKTPHKLYNDIWINVITSLRYPDLLSFRRTCKQLNKIVLQNTSVDTALLNSVFKSITSYHELMFRLLYNSLKELIVSYRSQRDYLMPPLCSPHEIVMSVHLFTLKQKHKDLFEYALYFAAIIYSYRYMLIDMIEDRYLHQPCSPSCGFQR